jgi:hypothetical protein
MCFIDHHDCPEDMSSVDVMIGPPIELWIGLDCTAGWSGALLV